MRLWNIFATCAVIFAAIALISIINWFEATQMLISEADVTFGGIHIDWNQLPISEADITLADIRQERVVPKIINV
jgi:hypothetical protein